MPSFPHNVILSIKHYKKRHSLQPWTRKYISPLFQQPRFLFCFFFLMTTQQPRVITPPGLTPAHGFKGPFVRARLKLPITGRRRLAGKTADRRGPALEARKDCRSRGTPPPPWTTPGAARHRHHRLPPPPLRRGSVRARPRRWLTGRLLQWAARSAPAGWARAAARGGISPAL